jgi:streptogramin lyase
MATCVTPEAIRPTDDAERTYQIPPIVLDRTIRLGGVSLWQTIGWVAAFLAAAALRLPRLDGWALAAGEAARAVDAWVLFRGQPPVTGEAIPNVGALLLLLQGIAFFLFGVTDVTARLVPALAGLVLVALPWTLRSWIGGPAALGMAALAAISPTLVYASRVISPEIVVSALALGAVICLVRLGQAGSGSGSGSGSAHARGPAIGLGVTIGAAFAAGPSAVTVALTLLVGVAFAALVAPEGAIRRGLRVLRGRGELLAFLLATIATAILCFTRFLSFPAGIAGAGETLAAWWRLLTESSGQPVQLFLGALLIYEPVAVVFAAVTLVRDRGKRGDAVAFCAGWFAAAFAVWSFSAGRGPEHAVHVALPLVLLAGIGVGTLLHEIAWAHVWRGSGGIMALLFLGIVVGLAAVGVLLTRVGDRGGDPSVALPAVAVLCLVVVPMAYLVWRLSTDEPSSASDAPVQSGPIALLVIALLLGAFGLRSANLLAFTRADLGAELLAQRTAAFGTLPTIEGFLHLSRDVGVNDGSARDPTGSHGLSIALERDVAWPYAWYFREFPDLAVVEPGTGTEAGSEVVIATSDAGLEEAGYAVDAWPWLTTVPGQYLNPDMGAITRAVVTPARWLDVWRFLLFRDGIPLPTPATVAVGLTPELAGRVEPPTGPFSLTDRAGPGAEPGQFRDPIGVAVGPDGVVAVVDSGNARVQRFGPDGALLGVWGEDNGGVTFTRTDSGLGPTGIFIAEDGTTWVADTWGHRIVALDPNGAVVQSIGGETVDVGDDPARVDEEGGRFFGPRDVAVTDDAIYVTDTGNERVQVFTRDGVFADAWGGYGSAPGQLIEPVGIAIGPDGLVYVADSGNARIAVFTPDGEPAAPWPVAAWPVPDPTGVRPAFQPYLAFDAEGNLYATSSNAGQVLVLDREGALIESITAAGSERLAQPIGIAVAPDGAVHVTDIGRDAVLEFVPPEPVTSDAFDAEDVGASPVP